MPGLSRRRAAAAAFISVFLVVALFMGATAIPSGAAVAGRPVAEVRSWWLAPAAVVAGGQRIGSVAPDARIGVDFVFAPSDPVRLAALIADQQDPSSPDYHRWLSPGQYQAMFGPSPGEVDALDRWLASVGLSPSTATGSVVHVEAPAAALERALQVHLSRYRSPRQGSFFTAGEPPMLPSDLASRLSAVVGLDDVVHLHSMLASAAPRILNPPGNVGDAYGIGTVVQQGFSGSGQTIGVYEIAAHLSSDISAFEKKYGYTNPVSTVKVDGGAPLDLIGGGTEEADLDIEDALAQAPGAAIVSYEGPPTGTGPLDVYAQIVNADVASSVTVSWGACETDWGASPSDMSAYHQLFEQAALQGQSIVAASGDSGSEDCYQTDGTTQLAVDYPGSDPYVTDVGGTTLNGPGVADTVWNDCLDTGSVVCASNGGGAGGGGMSVMYAKPAWQATLDTSLWPNASQPCGSSCRGVPDLSVDANPSTGYEIVFDGHSAVVGGTSAAAPVVAGLDADINQSCSRQTGDLAPDLYSYVQSSVSQGGLYGYAFTDVISGNNDLTDTNGGDFAAGPGWDLASGIGTPLAPGLICPQVDSISPSSAQAGSQVTVTGLNLGHATVWFGSVEATVDSASATQAVVTVPPGAGQVQVSASTPIGTGRSTAQFSYVGGSGAPLMGGYWLMSSTGTVYPFGTAGSFGNAAFPPNEGSAAAIVANQSGTGYWVASTTGSVQAIGTGVSTFPLSGSPTSPVVAMARSADGGGYWLATASGQVLTGGDATFMGDVSGLRLDAPVVSMAATPDGHGYWLLGGDGGVFSFGDAAFYGSTGGMRLNAPVVSMAATSDGHGYWLVATDGGVFSFGDAAFYGSTGGLVLAKPVVGMVVTPDGRGYWLVAADGGVFSFGDATFIGSLGGKPLPSPIVAMAAV